MATTPKPRWDRKQALEGLARLGTPAAWDAILKIAQGGKANPDAPTPARNDPVRAYAVLLLAEKGETSFLPALLDLIATGPEELRGDVLRALGFFHAPQAYQALYDKLHSPNPTDRMNAILGLKNLGTKDVVPTLLAMLNDPELQVRQVANFALQSLTGEKFNLPPRVSSQEPAVPTQHWHAWWRQHGANFVPVRAPACHDW
jgi:HEAT repeat protein